MKISLLIIISLLVLDVNAQTNSIFLEKTNQHSLSAEYVAVSYSYAYRFKKDVIFGLRAQIGLGLPKLLASTPTYVDYGYGNGPEKVTPGHSSFEVLKLQIFYRYAISNSFYFDVGPVASLTFGESQWEQPFRVGIETSVLYTYWKMHLGIRLNGSYNFGKNHQHPGITYETSYYALYITPLVIGFNF
jgi:hypothetical protein